MKTMMYPIAPDDDFPDEFCAIRQGSGEHWFYTPAGESASWALLHAESENAKLRELLGRGAARPIVVADDGTDGATGSCRCGACGQPIDPWDRWCRHCGTEVER